MAHRSRSPRGGNAEWISKAVVSLARYPEKRPAELQCDSTGAFLLTSLMAAWGDKQGVSSEDVIGGLWKNSETSAGTKRFEITDAGHGDWLIRVGASRRGGGGGGGSSSSTSQGWGGAAGGADSGGGRNGSSWKSDGGEADKWWEAKDDRSKDWQSKEKDSWQSKDKDSWQSKDKDRWQSKDKDKDSRKDSWSEADVAAWKAWKPGDDKVQADKWQKAEDAAPVAHAGVWAGGGAATSSTSPAARWPEADRIQKWIGFVLKSGKKECNIGQDGEWASLGLLAKAMSEQRPEFGITAAQQVSDMLQDTDRAGRFEIDHRGRIRKVERNQRQSREEPSHGGGGGGGGPRWGGTPPRSPRKLLTPAAPAGPAARHGAPADGVWTREVGEVATPAAAAAADKPAGPPGPGWTQYTDDGVLWWYYDGPEGKWWKGDDMKEPAPFEG